MSKITDIFKFITKMINTLFCKKSALHSHEALTNCIYVIQLCTAFASLLHCALINAFWLTLCLWRTWRWNCFWLSWHLLVSSNVCECTELQTKQARRPRKFFLCFPCLGQGWINRELENGKVMGEKFLTVVLAVKTASRIFPWDWETLLQ